MDSGDLTVMAIGFIAVMFFVINSRNEIIWQINQVREDIKEIKKNLYIMEVEDEEGDGE